MDDKSCPHLIDSLSAYLDGEARPEICAEIEEHVKICEPCRIVVDTLQQTVRLYRTLPEPKVPPGFNERLCQALDLEGTLLSIGAQPDDQGAQRE